MGYIREGRIVFANRAFEVEVGLLELALRHDDNGQEPIEKKLVVNSSNKSTAPLLESIDRFKFGINRPLHDWKKSTDSIFVGSRPTHD
jgi:hypothetical protein